MTTTSDLELFDFSKPSAMGGEKYDHLSHWINLFGTTFGETWNRVTGFDASIQLASCDVYTFENLKRRMPKPTVANYVSVGSTPFRSMLVVSQPVALAFVFQLLGEEITELPAERAMTSVEETLFEVFIGHFVDSLSQSWPEKEPLNCVAGAVEYEPHRSRMLGPREIVLLCKQKITIGGSEQDIDWLLPLKELELMVTPPVDVLGQQKQIAAAEIERRAAHIPVEISMQLGTCRLSVSSLSNLQKGDILVLDQPISEPMPILVSNRVKFFGWLGRNQNKRAYKISRRVTSKDCNEHNI